LASAESDNKGEFLFHEKKGKQKKKERYGGGRK
jgi:hypothetical protein